VTPAEEPPAPAARSAQAAAQDWLRALRRSMLYAALCGSIGLVLFLLGSFLLINVNYSTGMLLYYLGLVLLGGGWGWSAASLLAYLAIVYVKFARIRIASLIYGIFMLGGFVGLMINREFLWALCLGLVGGLHAVISLLGHDPHFKKQGTKP